MVSRTSHQMQVPGAEILHNANWSVPKDYFMSPQGLWSGKVESDFRHVRGFRPSHIHATPQDEAVVHALRRAYQKKSTLDRDAKAEAMKGKQLRLAAFQYARQLPWVGPSGTTVAGVSNTPTEPRGEKIHYPGAGHAAEYYHPKKHRANYAPIAGATDDHMQSAVDTGRLQPVPSMPQAIASARTRSLQYRTGLTAAKPHRRHHIRIVSRTDTEGNKAQMIEYPSEEDEERY